jgi:DNA adenine methylase
MATGAIPVIETQISRPALRYHGGKFRLAPWVMSFFPPHLCYVEPFGGAAGVLIQKPRSYSEVYNDLDGDIVNFFRVIRDPEKRVQLEEALILTPYAREEFEIAFEPTKDMVERARRTVIRAQMGFGSAGATKGQTGFRIDTKRAYGTAQHLWSEYPTSIVALGDRFRGVLIENRPAIEVIRAHDAPETLHFVDPPYLHSTRVLQGGLKKGKGGYYRHEMTDQDHEALLSVLLGLDGMVVVSGYESNLYHDHLSGWTSHSTPARISGGRGTVMRKEVVWINQSCTDELNRARGGLFA